MRTLVIVILSLFISTNVQSQDKDKAVKTVTIAVKGNCEECKKRIENAADIKGVKFSSWDEDAQAITVTYRPDKVSQEQIEKAIAGSGHDVAGVKANTGIYNKLPDCCKYRDKACEKK
jgi:mercuric ion binding protein